MAYLDFIGRLHKKTKRDYRARVLEHDKAHCAEIAKKYGREYWDGDRAYGYGGYVYDGRWAPVAQDLVDHYGLQSGHRVLDIGCGKAFLLFEMQKAVPGLQVRGIDVSSYALDHAREEMKPFLDHGSAVSLPYADREFDFVISLNVLHCFSLPDLATAVAELERVKRGGSYIVVESYRNEREKANLLFWQNTCDCILDTRAWEWALQRFGYTGDHSFIFFE